MQHSLNPLAVIGTIGAIGMAMASTLHSGAALAQAYPSKPVTIIVPFAAGGPVDTETRRYAVRLSEMLGQQFNQLNHRLNLVATNILIMIIIWMILKLMDFLWQG